MLKLCCWDINCGVEDGGNLLQTSAVSQTDESFVEAEADYSQGC